MKTTVNFSQFCDAFVRADRNDNFSYDGKKVLFNFLEELENDTGKETDLDVVAFCCEFSEDSAADIAENYSIDIEGLEEDEIIEKVGAYLSENSVLCGKVGYDSFVYAQF